MRSCANSVATTVLARVLQRVRAVSTSLPRRPRNRATERPSHPPTQRPERTQRRSNPGDRATQPALRYSDRAVTERASLALDDQTEVGSYFVATYPPFSVWTTEAVATEAMPALHAAPVAGVPLGLYLHIPFCRKRCHFCYFRVYTDKNAQEVEQLPGRRGARVGALHERCRPSPGGRSTSSTSAAGRRRSSPRSSSMGWSRG